jgi:hypothetical protein
VLFFGIATEFKMYRFFFRISFFLANILYQVAVFYSITSYATLFKLKKDVPLGEGHAEQSNRIVSPFHMKNIIQFWIVAEITMYVASIISIMIILAMSSCLKFNSVIPIVSALDDDSKASSERKLLI